MDQSAGSQPNHLGEGLIRHEVEIQHLKLSIGDLHDVKRMQAERIHTIANRVQTESSRTTQNETKISSIAEFLAEVRPVLGQLRDREARRAQLRDVLNWAVVAMTAYLAFVGRGQWGDVSRALGKMLGAG